MSSSFGQGCQYFKLEVISLDFTDLYAFLFLLVDNLFTVLLCTSPQSFPPPDPSPSLTPLFLLFFVLKIVLNLHPYSFLLRSQPLDLYLSAYS